MRNCSLVNQRVCPNIFDDVRQPGQVTMEEFKGVNYEK